MGQLIVLTVWYGFAAFLGVMIIRDPAARESFDRIRLVAPWSPSSVLLEFVLFVITLLAWPFLTCECIVDDVATFVEKRKRL